MPERPEEGAVSEAAASICKTSEASIQWLALALTPGLGPTKSRRVIEFFAGAQVVALDDPRYPAQLKQIYDPPLVLYVRGSDAVISQPGIALVGTRHPTPYGLGMSERLACDLAARGLVIFSGMARGIDTAGHRG